MLVVGSERAYKSLNLIFSLKFRDLMNQGERTPLLSRQNKGGKNFDHIKDCENFIDSPVEKIG